MNYLSLHRQAIGQRLLLITIFLIPWQARWIALPGLLNGDPWEYGTVSVYLIDSIILLTVICAVSVRITRQQSWSITELLIGLLVIIACLSTYDTTNNINGVWSSVTVILAASLAYSILWLRPHLHHIAAAILAAGCIQSLLAIVQFITQRVSGYSLLGMAEQLPATPGVLVISVAGQRILRAYGSFPHPNILAGFLVICLLIALGWWCQAATRRSTLLLGGCMIILVTGMMLTFSRQAMLGVGMGVFVMLIGYFFKQRTPPYRLLTGMSIMIVPMILIGTLCTNLVATRLTGNAPLEQRSLVERSTYVDDSLRLLREQWLFGVGQGNYTAILERQDRSAGVMRSGFEYQPVHNVTLLIFTELGIPGLLAWLLLLISLLFPTHQITPPAPMQPWRLTMHAVLAALIIIGLFDHYLWSLHPGLLLLWLVIGLTALSQDTKKEAPPPTLDAHHPFRLL